MKRTALVFGAIGGVLVAVLRLVEYRFLVVEHSLQIYGGLVAAVFAGVGLWLGITIAGRRQAAGKEFRRPGPPSFVVLTFGLASGAVMSLLMLATLPCQDAIGFENGALVGCTGMVLAFLLVYFGVRSYRDRESGGTVGFGRGLAVGLLIALVSSACYVATWEVIFFGLQPDFLEKYQAYAVEKARRAGESEAAIDRQKAEMAQFAKMYRNPLVNAAITFVEPLPVGLLFAVGSAAALRRKRARDAA
jgi:hypothetical protein